MVAQRAVCKARVHNRSGITETRALSLSSERGAPTFKCDFPLACVFPFTVNDVIDHSS